jgi:spermidine synthase
VVAAECASAAARPVGSAENDVRSSLVYLTVVLMSACGLGFELALGAVSTFMLGDSVTQLSVVIGVYLFAMGVGAYLTRWVEDTAAGFVSAQLGAALVGGLSAPLLYVSFARSTQTRPVLFLLVLVTGTFIGAELPLLIRLLRRQLVFRDLVARALSLDYAGALVGAVSFGVFFLPKLGFLRSGLLFGFVHAASAVWSTFLFVSEARALRVRGAVVFVVLGGAALGTPRLVSAADEATFTDPVVLTRQTAYQRISITAGHGGMNLFLDGNLQFSEYDEYRYHEALVHPPMSAARSHGRVLVLGGGDGLALRELETYADVQQITIVDLDPQMTELSRTLPKLAALNKHSFDDPRVTLVSADAFVWLAAQPSQAQWDVVIVDFPDPNNFALGKLYTVHFYRILASHLADGARVSVQSTSPLVARKSFWCVIGSMEAAGLFVRPYHAFVPAFGEWGYALAGRDSFEPPTRVPPGLRYLTGENLAGLFVLSPDMQRPAGIEENRLNNQALVRYYDEEWHRFTR